MKIEVAECYIFNVKGDCSAIGVQIYILNNQVISYQRRCAISIDGRVVLNKLGLSWAKLSSNWYWNFDLLPLKFVALN